jgi:DMSO/TMAO reductase YedYZ molybdopterin-dependent catalytic subunit
MKLIRRRFTFTVSPAVILAAVSLVFVAPLRAEAEEFAYLSLFEGLHITGTPVEVDIAAYRLTVTGKVRNEHSLSFDEVKKMKSSEVKLKLDCPGYFIDIGVWTGVHVKTILERAGLQPDAKMVIFSTADESYRTRFPVEELLASETMLIAYRFEGREFHRVHGFPLRLAAGGKEGSDWVKWLGKIIVE